MKKFSLFVCIASFIGSINCFGSNLKTAETTSIPVEVRVEIVQGIKVSEKIKINNNLISIENSDAKSVSINKQKLSKKNNVFSYDLKNNEKKFIEVDIKL
ncbi:MAG: hypothetical protein ACRC6J_02890 [Cetobacterium sp.]